MKNAIRLILCGLLLAVAYLAITDPPQKTGDQTEYVIPDVGHADVLFVPAIDTGPQIHASFISLPEQKEESRLWIWVFAIIAVMEIVLRLYPSVGDNTIFGNILKILVWLSDAFNRKNEELIE
jgi:hypothetical protein